MIRRILADRGLLAAIGLACLFRVGAFVGLIVRPVANERGEPVSPLLQQAYFDFEFYFQSLARYTEDWSVVFFDLVRFYADPAVNVGVLISPARSFRR